MDIALIIERLVPSASYQGSTTDNTEDSYSTLVWADERTKPTWQQITDEAAIYTKEDLFTHLAAYRYSKEVGGVVIGGLPVPTDDRTKTLLVGAYNDAIYEANPTRERKFKIGSGFITLTNADLMGIALTIAAHVQKCFDCESTIFSQILDNSITTKSGIETAFDAAYAQ